MCSFRILLVLLLAFASSGCYVVSLTGIVDAPSVTFDEQLLGHWSSSEDDIDIVLERGEWQTYLVTLRDHSGEQRFTGRLTAIGAERFFDLTVDAGIEAGAALVPVHIVGRLSVRDERLLVELLDYAWFRKRPARGGLALPGVLDEREAVVITAGREQLRRWLTANARSPLIFDDALTLARVGNPSK